MEAEKDKVSKERGYFVAKDNRLITHSRYSLTTQQHRLLLYMISKIKPNDIGDEEYTIRTKDIVDVCGYTQNSGYYYQSIKKDIQKISAVSCWVETDPGREKLFRWIDTAELDHGRAEFKIKFHSTVIPYLFELRRNYTQYSLYNMMCLSGKYSIRLYEYLLSMQYKETIEVSISELKKRIDAEQYTKISHFKERVLEPAILDINAYTELNMEYEYKKTGRTITHIVFRYHNQDFMSYSMACRMREAKINPERRKAEREQEKRREERLKRLKMIAEKKNAIQGEGMVIAQMTLDELMAELEGKAHENN